MADSCTIIGCCDGSEDVPESTITPGQGLPTGDHTRYALLTLTADVPDAAAFLASAITSQTKTIDFPAHDDGMYYHVAEIYDDISDIREEGTAENFRDHWTARADLPERDLGGETYYIYTTAELQLPAIEAIPIEFYR